MDPVLIEFAKYGLAAFLAALVMAGLTKACIFLFKKYDVAKDKSIEIGERALTKMSENTLATQMNTAAIDTLRDVLKARGK